MVIIEYIYYTHSILYIYIIHTHAKISHTDTVEDLIRISVEGPSLEDFDARESVASWFSQGQRARRPNYKCWPSEGHVTARGDLL